ncbi:MAG: hypothetical protein WA705_09470 [Candidatus Ozemobacteraceae bacterium]
MLKKISFVTMLFVLALSASAFAGDLMGLLPQDTAFIVNVNMGKMLTTDMVKKQVEDGLAKQSPEQKKSYDEFVSKTGLDPLKNIQEIMVYVVGKVDPKAEKPEVGVLINGSFDVAKILKAVSEDPKAKEDTIVEKFEGFDAIRGKKEADGTAVFLDANTVVIGTAPALKAVVAVKNGKGPSLATNAAFANLLKKADIGASVFGVGLMPASLKEQAKANPQAAPLAAINALFFAFNYDNDLTFNFTGELDKKESLEGVMTSLNGFLAMVKMIAGQSPEAGEVLNMIKIEGAETTAKITLKVAKAKLDEIKKKIEEKAKSGALALPGAPAPGVKPAPDAGKPAPDVKPAEEGKQAPEPAKEEGGK